MRTISIILSAGLLSGCAVTETSPLDDEPGTAADHSAFDLSSLIDLASAQLAKDLTSSSTLWPAPAWDNATIFYAGATGDPDTDVWHFNNHAYITYFDHRFFAMWSSGFTDEDAVGQHVRFATSDDAASWSSSAVLAAFDPTAPQRYIARGFIVTDGALYALAAQVADPVAWTGLELDYFEWNGSSWDPLGPLLSNCMSNFPPALLVSGRYFMTCRTADGQAMHTALSAVGDWRLGWTITPLAGKRMSEPSTYVDTTGVLHTIFRDPDSGGFVYQSTSEDVGVTWTQPVQTNFEDGGSKNYSDTLSSGVRYLINNPKPGRTVLDLSVSGDGRQFTGGVIVRDDLPALRYPGTAKGSHSAQYPDALELDGELYIVYGVNKEDIGLTKIPVASLAPPT